MTVATLHILSNPAAAESCARALAAEDRLLLLADGVRARGAMANAKAACVGVLRDAEDQATAPALPDHVQSLSYADFVAWVVACERSVTWT